MDKEKNNQEREDIPEGRMEKLIFDDRRILMEMEDFGGDGAACVGIWDEKNI